MQRRSVGQASDLAASRSAVSHAPRRRSSLLFCVLLAAGTFVVYSQAGSLSFISIDDPVYVSENPQVQSGLSLEGIRWSLGIRDYNWIPLTWWSLMLDSNLFGIGPAGYHITNVLLHIANTLLLFATLAAATGNSTRSAFVAALFAIHPLHVESVAWVAERKDVLSVFFGLLSLRVYVGYAKKGHAWRLVGSFLLFVCSLLSKPTLVTLPFVFLLLDYWPLARLNLGHLIPNGEPSVAFAAQLRMRERTPRSSEKITSPLSNRTVLNRVAEKIPFFAGSAAFSAIALFSQSSGGAMKAHFSFSTRFGNAIVSYLTYLEKAAYPVNLAVFYPHPNLDLAWTKVALAASILLAITVAAIVSIRRFPFLFVGCFWYLGTLVPMIGLVQIGTQQMADRYTYFPLIGVFLAVVWLATDLAPAGFLRQRVLPLAGLAWLGLLASIAFSQASYWHDSVTLLRHAESCTPDNSVIHEFLGSALLGENSLDESVSEYRAAIRLAETYAPLHGDLAAVYELLARNDEALAEYRTAISLDPRSVDALNGIARILIERGQFDEAGHQLKRALELDAENALTYASLATLSVKTGDFAGGLAYAARGLELNPGLYLCDLRAAQALRGLGRFDEAVRRLERLAEVAPGDALVRQELAQTLEQQRGAPAK
jgi:protein O-mannosyl-transferase